MLRWLMLPFQTPLSADLVPVGFFDVGLTRQNPEPQASSLPPPRPHQLQKLPLGAKRFP